MADEKIKAESQGRSDVSVEAEPGDIRKRLMSSISFRSLRSERNIIDILKRMGWDTSHAAYYHDTISRKTREIDVVGRTTWRREHMVGTLRNYLSLVFEVKSNAGYHLIFAEGGVKRLASHQHWIGSDNDTRKGVLGQLEEIGLDPEQLRSVDQGLNDAASPNDGPILFKGLRAEPPEAPFYTSGYRETSIGNEKELDNSVLWRAGLALSSAVNSYKKFVFDNEMHDTIAFTTEAIKAGDSPLVEAMKWLEGFVRDYYLFHPILVIDSPMWAVKGSELEELKWCRFIETKLDGTYDWWFDVVHSSAIEAYLTELTQHYADFYQDKTMPDQAAPESDPGR